MPDYTYRCDKNHEAIITHSIFNDPEVLCKTCGAVMKRKPGTPLTTFKGSGFYTTDKNA